MNSIQQKAVTDSDDSFGLAHCTEGHNFYKWKSLEGCAYEKKNIWNMRFVSFHWSAFIILM